MKNKMLSLYIKLVEGKNEILNKNVKAMDMATMAIIIAITGAVLFFAFPQIKTLLSNVINDFSNTFSTSH